ncbi:hypothetical protein LFR94_004453 [Vibrio vulnificus]|uniref:hypothetical protein n=1 Tax=Vibrio vulnificus TaxID=672 RepID=UPI001A30E666|nr:hypothetical protein [Vibrio vulnificus]EGQ9240231.1 hypothetical protein [Vibrio vulnificus]EGR7964382.1 hypothetical protein [Vibrio vulnificus]EGR7987014.1 hypothetical protein [Vibrio vulnificus]EHV9861378.1 hypothetical protein [Vibrio vulnificus]
MSLEDAIIKHLDSTTSAIETAYTCCDDFIAIGGIALHCHMSSIGLTPIISTHDADVICGNTSYCYVRDEFDLGFNARMNKHEYKVVLPLLQGEKSVDVDVYVIYQNGLQVEVQEVIENAIIINNVKCAHLVHLLVLKVDNYTNFDGNKDSDKYTKIVHDILQIIGLLSIDSTTEALIKRNFNEIRLNALCSIVQHHPDIYTTVCTLFKVTCFTKCFDDIRNCA